MNEVTCCAVAGLGFMGREHLSHYKSFGLRAVVIDPHVSSEAAAAAGADALYATLDSALAAEPLQVLDICLPTPLHRPFAIAGLEAGLHVLLEKPLAFEPDDITAICQAADKASGRLMVAQVCRFFGQYRRARALLTEGVLGQPLTWHAWRLSATPDWSMGNWLGNRAASGGTLYDLHIHELDLAMWLFGHPQDGHIIESTSPAVPHDGYFQADSSIRFANGVYASIHTSQLQPANYPFTTGFRLLGTEGTLEFEVQGEHSRYVLYAGGKTEDFTDWYRSEAQPENPYGVEIRHFLDCIASGAPFDITHGEARDALAFTRHLSGLIVLPQPR